MKIFLETIKHYCIPFCHYLNKGQKDKKYKELKKRELDKREEYVDEIIKIVQVDFVSKVVSDVSKNILTKKELVTCCRKRFIQSLDVCKDLVLNQIDYFETNDFWVNTRNTIKKSRSLNHNDL